MSVTDTGLQAEVESLRDALAEAREARLREALGPLAEHGRVCRVLRPGHGGRIAAIHSAHTPEGEHTLTWEHCDAAARALALPHDRTALDALLADARREGARAAARRCVAAAKALDASNEGRKRMGVTGPCAILSAWHDGACSAWSAVEAEAARIEAEGA